MVWTRTSVGLAATVLLHSNVAMAESAAQGQPEAARRTADWKQIRTPGLLVLGNARPEDLRRTAEEIERFRLAIRALSPNLPMDSPVPMVAVVFRDDHALTPFKPRNRGKPVDNVAAYFGALPDINYIVLAPSDNREFTYRVIFHEYTHFLVNRSSPRLPMWLNEGLAEFYSTFNGSEQDSRMIVGRPIPAHRMLLREAGGLIPLKKFLDSTALPALLRDPRSTQRFYAQSWALTHYLLLGDARIHQPKLRAFMAAMQTGESSDRAFAKAFGDNVDALHAGFLSYLNRAAMPAVQVPQVTLKLDGSIEQIAELDAQQIQGDLLVRQGAFEEADKYLAKALAIDPPHVPSRLSRARRLVGDEQVAEALDVLSAPDLESAPDFAIAFLRAARPFAQRSVMSRPCPCINGQSRRGAIRLLPTTA